MTNYISKEIKGLLLRSIQEHDSELELRLCFHDSPSGYMTTTYDDHCSFQRCGDPKEAGDEYNHKSLDKLHNAQQVDRIVLEKDWKKTREL